MVEPDYTLWTVPSCNLCERAKKFMNENSVPFKEVMIGRDITREEAKRKFPYVRNLPVILVGNTQIDIDTMMNIVMMDKKNARNKA